MNISTSFEELDSAMLTVTSIVSDKMLSEDLKNVIVWIKDGVVRFAAYNGNIISATEVGASLEGVGNEEEHFFQLKAKDINDVVASLKGLKRTKVDRVTFEIKENEALMHIFETALDEEMVNAESYNQESKFRIQKPRLKDAIRNEVQKVNIAVEGSHITAVDVLLYINSLYPTVMKETRESTNNVLFGKEHVYTMLPSYSAVLQNKLPEVLSGFRLKNSVVNFLKNFIAGFDSFSIDKEDKGNGMIILTVRAGNSVAEIKCADMSRAFDMTNFITTPSNGIVVDKAYLIDVLKRMSLSSEAAFVEINIANGSGDMKVLSKAMTQNIPVIKAKGEGSFAFSIRPELLSNVIFSHIQGLDENVFLYLENGDKNNVVLAVKDNTELWQTKVTGLSQGKGNFWS